MWKAILLTLCYYKTYWCLRLLGGTRTQAKDIALDRSLILHYRDYNSHQRYILLMSIDRNWFRLTQNWRYRG